MAANGDNSPASLPPLQTNLGLPPKVVEAFLNWQPTVPSSWTTPPESKGHNTPVLPWSDDSSPIWWDYYVPQMLIHMPDNLHLHAAHTPYSAPNTLQPEDTTSSVLGNSYPCPTPEFLPTTSTSPIPIPIPPHLVDEHPVGPLHPDSGLSDPQSPLLLPHSMPPHQEAKEVQAVTGGEVLSGADGPDNEANPWVDANQESAWEAYGQGATPKGFILNDGADYVPFNIHLPNSTLKPAKYIKIKWGEDPCVYGMVDGDPYQYVESFQATPMPSAGPLCTYSLGQLEFFKEKHNLHPEVDNAVDQLHDWSAMAKVGCFCYNKEVLKQDWEELRQIENDIWKREMMSAGCTHQLAGAWILQRIKVVNWSHLCFLMQEYKHCHGRWS